MVIHGGSNRIGRKGKSLIRLCVKHPKVVWIPWVIVYQDGSKVIANNTFGRKDSGRQSDLAVQVFAEQVKNASANGFNAIEVDAKGSFDSDDHGYCFWPLLWCDRTLRDVEDDFWNEMAAGTPEFANDKETDLVLEIYERFPKACTIREVMTTPLVEIADDEAEEVRRTLQARDDERGIAIKPRDKISGLEWWLVNGRTITGMRFDLAEGSLSRRILAAYLVSKKENWLSPGARRFLDDEARLEYIWAQLGLIE